MSRFLFLKDIATPTITVQFALYIIMPRVSGSDTELPVIVNNTISLTWNILFHFVGSFHEAGSSVVIE